MKEREVWRRIIDVAHTFVHEEVELPIKEFEEAEDVLQSSHEIEDIRALLRILKRIGRNETKIDKTGEKIKEPYEAEHW